ncbi:hypothetical protein ABZX12_39105 [Kribbella sp. NPDC003505]|uniref:hypothetical protein n=1 Tax=Kribbella sp. NPDC003505 TaxID=3154448 RepID=UPI0033B80EA8
MSEPVLVVTAMPMSPRARADLSELLGDGYIVQDIKTAPDTADILLTPVVSSQLLGNLRRLYPRARILFTELHDDGYGIQLSGPMTRIAAAGPDGYFVANALEGVAPIVQSEARLALTGNKQRTPPRIAPSAHPATRNSAPGEEAGCVVWLTDATTTPSAGQRLELAVYDTLVSDLLHTETPRKSLIWAALVAETAEHLATEEGKIVWVDLSGLSPLIVAELQIRVASALVNTATWPPS